MFSQQKITLQQALEKALQNNFNIKISKIEVDQSKLMNTKGGAGMLPSLGMRVGQQQTLQEQNNPNSVLQGQIFTSNTSPTLELNWNLFKGFLAQTNKKKLEQIEVLSNNNAELVLQNTLLGVTLAYFNCTIEKDKLNALKQTLIISRLNVNRTKKKAERGLVSSFDALQDYNNYFSDSSNYIQQVQFLDRAKRILNKLLIDSSSKNFNDLPELAVKMDLDSLLNHKNDIPTIRSYIINKQILKQDKKAAMSDRYPSLSMNLGSNLNSTYVKTEQFSIRPAPSWQSYINFTLNFNLFNGGKTRIAIKNAEQNIQIQSLKIDDAIINIKTDIRNTYYQHMASRKVLAIEIEKLNNSKKLRQQAQRKYEIGTLNSFNYRQIQLNHTKNELNVSNLKFNVLNSFLELLKLTGNVKIETLLNSF